MSSHYLPEKERTVTNQFLLYHSKVNSTLFSLCYTGIMGCCLSILVCYFMAHEHSRGGSRHSAGRRARTRRPSAHSHQRLFSLPVTAHGRKPHCRKGRRENTLRRCLFIRLSQSCLDGRSRCQRKRRRHRFGPWGNKPFAQAAFLPCAVRNAALDGGATSVAYVLLRFMAALVPVVFVLSGVIRGSWITSFLFSLSVAVGLVPELLPMVVTVCLARRQCGNGKKRNGCQTA